jgi:drug/metabolite transporter (DMT)-like permease
MQFVLVTVFTYNTQQSLSNPPLFLRNTKVPFQKLFLSAAMFYTVNMLNNWAFAFNISVPVHIILRSFGSVTTMAAGWLRGRWYSPIQVLAVAILTTGVIISAWADAESKVRRLCHSNNGIESVSMTNIQTGQDSRY